ncbi:MAG: Na/Pi cotransporter family protein [Clostridia bacterium]|nr:Na/Pi cotransporter family protein [Clostridia bacterium]
MLVENFFFLLGAISIFLYGLKILSEGISQVVGGKISALVKGATSNKYGAILTGIGATAIAQSSVATNMIVITFVEKGIISFVGACAVIMGTNIGTTVTAQLVSLSTVSNLNVTAIGSFIAFIGLLLYFCKKQNLKSIGLAALGFGFIFIGIELLTKNVECFEKYAWFTSLFKVKNPLLLLLNGFVITAILQSSSVASSVMIVLGSIGLIDFKSAMFLILGANVGTCLPVIFSSLSMGKESIKCSIFNIAFNIAGVVIFFLPLVFLGDKIAALSVFSAGIGRSIANFHTLFNVAVTLILTPMLKYFCKLVDNLYIFLFTEKPKKGVTWRAFKLKFKKILTKTNKIA